LSALLLGLMAGLLPADGLEAEVRVSVRWSLLMNLSEADQSAMQEGLHAALKSWDVRGRFDAIDADCLSRPACVTTSFMRAGAEEEWMLSVVRLGDDVRVEGLRTRSEAGEIRSTSIAPFVVDRDRLAEARAWLPSAPSPRLLAPEPELAPLRRRPVPLGSWIAGGVAATALGIGVGFGVSAAGLESGLEADGCAARPCGLDRIDRLEDHARIADVSYGVAGAAAATAVLLFFLRPAEP